MPRHPPTPSGHSFSGGLRRPDGFGMVLITHCSPSVEGSLPRQVHLPLKVLKVRQGEDILKLFAKWGLFRFWGGVVSFL